MKKCALILALVLLLLCTACGKTATPGSNTTALPPAMTDGQPQTAAQWLSLLAENLPFDDNMAASDNAAAVYGIVDEDNYTGDCALYISTMATPEEIAVFRADDALSTDDLTAFAYARLARQQASYEDYAPAEVPKIESAVVRTCSDFVIVCVCADNAKAETLLDSYA